MTKKFTFPISNKHIYDSLADIALEVEGKVDDPQEFKHDVVQDLAFDAFSHSFTPSGEIGDNPNTPRIAESFYDALADIFGVSSDLFKSFKGTARGDRAAVVGRQRMRRFRSAVVNLIQLYLETNGYTTSDRPKNDRKVKRERNTSFNYKKVGDKKSPAAIQSMTEVERNRYFRIFVATIFFRTINDLMLAPQRGLRRVIEDRNLDNTKKLSPEDALKMLRSPANRRKFIEATAALWNLEIRPKESIVKVPKPRPQEEGEQGELL